MVGVSGSGERMISLMDHEDCKNYVAVDVNEEALFLLELKLTALEVLPVDEYWQFIGHHTTPGKIREIWFEHMKNKLTPACRLYWEKKPEAIRQGILNIGHFEKFLARIRPFLIFFLGKYIVSLCTGGSADNNQFPGYRWKLVMWLFSRRWIYQIWGNKDVAFVSKDASIMHIPVALNDILYHGETQSCFMAHLLFKGHLRDMQDSDLPPSMQREVLQRIRQRLISATIKIQYHHTDILTFMQKNQATLEPPVFYSLSDILSFELPDYLDKFLQGIHMSENTVVWRTFLRHRTSTSMFASLEAKYPGLRDYTEKESTRMYQVYAIGPKLPAL